MELILAFNGCDTLRPMGIRFRPFVNGVNDDYYDERFKANTNHIRELLELLSQVIVIGLG